MLFRFKSGIWSKKDKQWKQYILSTSKFTLKILQNFTLGNIPVFHVPLRKVLSAFFTTAFCTCLWKWYILSHIHAQLGLVVHTCNCINIVYKYMHFAKNYSGAEINDSRFKTVKMPWRRMRSVNGCIVFFLSIIIQRGMLQLSIMQPH